MDTRCTKVFLALLAVGLVVSGAETVASAQDSRGFVDKSYPSDYYRVPDSKGWMHTDNAGWIHFENHGADTTKPAESAKGFTDHSYPADYYRPPDLTKQSSRMGQNAGNLAASAHPQATQQSQPMVPIAK